MNRIKNIEEVIIREDMLFCEIVKENKLIVTPESANDNASQVDYMIVKIVGDGIKDVKVGDIVVAFDGSIRLIEYKDKSYGKIQRYNCSIIVRGDNFVI